MALLGLVVKPGVEAALELAGEIVRWVGRHAHQLILEPDSELVEASLVPRLPRHELAKIADPIITLGGDGTLIGVARHVSGKSPVLIGVNFGHLGFLTEVAPQDLFSVIDAVLADRAKLGVRQMLAVEVIRAGQVVFRSQAVNEAAIVKGGCDRLLSLDLSVNGEGVMRVESDGLLVATPTGSTAYSLSAGGSIVVPWLSVMLVTPICAHSLTTRPLILDDQSLVEVVVPRYDGTVFVTVDGQVSNSLEVGDFVKVTRSPNKVKFVQSDKQSYFEILRTKLHWGLVNQSAS